MKIWTSVLIGALVLAGCSSGDETPPPAPTQNESPSLDTEGTPSPTEEPEKPRDPAQTVDVEFFGAQARLSIYPIERSGEALLADIEVEPTGAPTIDLKSALSRQTTAFASGAEDLRLVDREAGRVVLAAQNAQLQPVGTKFARFDATEEGQTLSILFSAQVGDSVDLHVPNLGYIADIPVYDTEDPADFDRRLSELGGSGDVSSESFELGVRSAGYDEFSDVRQEDNEINWTISADVLFDFGEHKLDGMAKKAVEETISEIKDLAVDDAEIHLIGHTDDQGSAAFNQDLSERRAASVRKIFEEKLPASYTVTSEGKGKTEPAVEGTSEDARAANRRVEILFTAKETESIISGEADNIPDADVLTASGNDQIVFKTGPADDSPTAGVAIRSLRELDENYLLGLVEVELIEVPAGQTILSELFVKGGLDWKIGRSLSPYLQGDGTGLLTIATNGGRVYPLEYISGKNSSGADTYDVLGDAKPVGVLTEGDHFYLSVVWPNPGADSVTIDVPDRMRFTDVPVE